MVAPRRHAAAVSDLHPDELLDLVRAVCLAARASYAAWFTASSWSTANIGPKASCNIGFNFGPHGCDHLGLEGLGHLHVHVVPRNPDDTNFMWWSTRASILHLKDMPVRQAFSAEIARLEGLQKSSNDVGAVPSGGLGQAAGHQLVFEPDFADTHPSQDQCPLCREHDALRSNEHGRVLFSVKPYKFGHVMVIPNRHVANLELCSDEEVLGLFALVSEAGQVAMEATGADSYSVGINIGPHSGASIPSHLHIHIVPRSPHDSSMAYWPSVEAEHGGYQKPKKLRALFEQRYGSPDLHAQT
eukprot:SM000023S07545  [mRNA]  locus=s23:30355:32149:- [translate_table: standard]